MGTRTRSRRPGSGPADLPELVEALSQAGAYARPVGAVEVLRTHISVLFFAGERVYKLKKPVRLEFLDYSSVERRRAACEDEVRLNARTSPEMYLGVRPVTREADGRLVVDGRGAPVDWVVEMVRLPAERMLDALLERDRVDDEALGRVARLLVDFHGRAASGRAVDAYGRPEAVAREVLANLEQLRRAAAGHGDAAPREALDFLERWTRRFLDERRALLARRVADGRIREGHGDLHAGNICLTDEGIRVYDCVEFDLALRCGDVASDLAFLAMDLEHRGHRAAADLVVRTYAEHAGDAELGALLGFYKVYRALVRAKVALVRCASSDLDREQRVAAALEARRYFQLAVGYALPAGLVLVGGLPASGKSTVARYLAGRLGAELLRSDVVRKQRAPQVRPAAHGAGPYSEAARGRVYRALLERAVDALLGGASVVVDASFARRAFRGPFLDAAARLDVPWTLVWLEVPEALALERLARRAARPDEPSDADADVLRGELRRVEPPDEAPGARLLRASGQDAPERVCGALQARWIGQLAERA